MTLGQANKLSRNLLIAELAGNPPDTPGNLAGGKGYDGHSNSTISIMAVPTRPIIMTTEEKPAVFQSNQSPQWKLPPTPRTDYDNTTRDWNRVYLLRDQTRTVDRTPHNPPMTNSNQFGLWTTRANDFYALQNAVPFTAQLAFPTSTDTIGV